jgi:CubicO group peptidase (beta-lactamase class C family)
MKHAAVLVLALSLVRVEAAPPAIPPQASAALSEVLRAAVTRGDVPAVEALVVDRDGVLYHEAFGMLNVARGVALPKDAIFRIASMTKPVTSLAAMMLVEERKLRLDDEVSRYLPAFKNRQVMTAVDQADGTLETRPAARPMTIRHLLTHTSGIGYAWSDPREAAVQKKLGLSEPELPLLHDPGDRWTYSASTRVLGDVIAAISGRPLDVVLQSRVFAPLGMNDTTFAVPREKYARVVTAYQRTNSALVELPNPEVLDETVRGDGGLYSTASDYGTFLRVLLNDGQLGGHRLASAATIRQMTQNQIGRLVIEQQPAADGNRTRPYPLGAGRDKWGFGFQLAAAPLRDGMRSGGSYSWGGIYNTHFWVDPQRSIGVVLLMQLLPFYDDRAIALLQGFERSVNASLK